MRQSNQDVWVTWVGERFDLLAERGVDIPIMDDINALRDKFFADFEKSHPE